MTTANNIEEIKITATGNKSKSQSNIDKLIPDQIYKKEEQESDKEKSKKESKKEKSKQQKFKRKKIFAVKKFVKDKEDEWMVTYSDMMSLLLTFFVMLFAMSSLDKEKFKALTEAISVQLLKKADTSSEFEIMSIEFLSVVKKYNLENQIEVNVLPDGIKMEFHSASLYESGSAEIKEHMIPALAQIADILNSMKYQNYIVEVEGHTDDVPIKTLLYPSNWELSVHRATNVVKFLIERGVSPDRLKAAGYADTKPKVPNKDEAGNPIPENREKNRRIVIFIQKNQN
jgi:chemotaxis protein MotB